jgi:hypothetical protein
VGITRFQLQRFTVSIKELADWFGLGVVLPERKANPDFLQRLR